MIAPYFPIVFVGAEPRPASARTHPYTLDVVMSYAGEDRPYVEQVAEAMTKRGAKVYYDRDKQGEMIGSDLERRLPQIYGEQAKYCLMFISRHYMSKKWPSMEREVVLARAARDDSEYVIPVRLDSTEVPGLSESIVFLDASNTPPEAVANVVAQKLPDTGLFSKFDHQATRTYRRANGALEQQIIDSPITRLQNEFGYAKLDLAGAGEHHGSLLPPKAIFLFDEYYFSRGAPRAEPWKGLKHYAHYLNEMILEIRDRTCGSDEESRSRFRVYLIAHSLGGLVCRCLLQHPDFGAAATKAAVQKLITFGTAHNGMDSSVISEIETAFAPGDLAELDRARLSDALGVGINRRGKSLSNVADMLDPSHVLCIVGTNRDAYGAVKSSRPGDGLVHIKDAVLQGSPYAYVSGCHGGTGGVLSVPEVSEMVGRYLFGDIRVDGRLEIQEITLPAKVQEIADSGKEIKASYSFEVELQLRGLIGSLHRQWERDQTALVRSHRELGQATEKHRRHVSLFSLFLASGLRLAATPYSFRFSIDLRVPAPVYEVDNRPLLSEYYGGFLLRETIRCDFGRTEGWQRATEGWILKYGFESDSGWRHAKATKTRNANSYRIPLVRDSNPGIRAVWVALFEGGAAIPPMELGTHG